MPASTLYFQIEPLNAPPVPGGTFLVVWPEPDGNGRYCHHAHPNRTVMEARAGDVLVHKRTPYRMLGVKIYRSSLCTEETRHPWQESVADCLAELSNDGHSEAASSQAILPNVALALLLLLFPPGYVLSFGGVHWLNGRGTFGETTCKASAGTVYAPLIWHMKLDPPGHKTMLTFYTYCFLRGTGQQKTWGDVEKLFRHR